MNTRGVRGKHPFWIGLLAGLVAGIAATGVMLLLNATSGGISLPEVIGSEFTLLIPPSLFDSLHLAIGAAAKHYLFYGILVGQCLVFALSGAVFHQGVTARWQRLHWYQGLLLALILWLLTGTIPFQSLAQASLARSSTLVSVLACSA